MIILRLDDVGMDDEQFQIMHEIITELELPCTYAVVPFYLNEELASQIKLPFIQTVLHGYRHENHGNFEKSEFGDERSYENQKQDLTTAKNLYEQHLPPTNTFVPPWHHMNEDTAKILKELSYTNLSISEREKTRIEGKLARGFNSTYIQIYYDPTDNEDDVLLLKKVLAMSKQHYAGVLLHHNLLIDQKAINRTRQFLTLLKKSAEKFNIPFKTLDSLE